MSISLKTRLAAGLAMLDWRALTARPGRCPACGPTLFLRINRSDFGIRCARCASAPNTLAIVTVLQSLAPRLEQQKVYAMTAAGPLFEYLNTRAGELTCSVYNADVAPGELHQGVQCQDVQALQYADQSFDWCIHSEVFEHVPDDGTGFAELWRVLRPGGATVFTVPVFDRQATLERARLENGEVQYLMEPSYHDDQLRGRVLAFRDYGRDITERLTAAGFVDVQIFADINPAGLEFDLDGFQRPVIVGFRPQQARAC